MRILTICALLSSACGPNFDLDQPIVFDVKPLGLGAFFDQTVEPTLRGALKQLGASAATGPTINPTVRVSRADPGDCDGVDARRRGLDILICPTATVGPNAWFEALYHELGHTLGAGHLPCETQAIMAPSWSCNFQRGIAPDYTSPDIAEICGNGHTVGGVCGRPATR